MVRAAVMSKVRHPRNFSRLAVHRSLKRQAIREGFIDAGGVQAGYWHLSATELLWPKPAPWSELVLPPRAVR